MIENKQKKSGITLIALVVTIVVLLILAGVTITFVLGEGGILDMAKEAADRTNNAIANEQGDMSNLVEQISDILEGKDPETLKDAVSSKKVFSNTTGYDSDGNKVDGSNEEKKAVITIPAGFKITEGDITKINEGVVISDDAGNEFVWVPCTTDEYKKHDYKGETNDYDKNIEDTGETGWNTWRYRKYNDWTGDTDQESKNKESVAKYGGFYIARYEAGIPSSMSGVYVDSKSATKTYTCAEGKNNSDYAPVSKKGAQVWNYIEQTNAKKAAERMYSGNRYVTSQLVDGEAWDRTVDWIMATSGVKDIEKDSTNYGNYATNGTNENNGGIKYKGFEVENTLWAAFLRLDGVWYSPKNYQYGKFTAGYSDPWTGNNKTDFNLVEQEDSGKTYKYQYLVEMATGAAEETKLNNIYDLAGNVHEWTTETGYHNEPVQTESRYAPTQYAVFCGGSFDNDGTETPVSYRQGANTIGEVFCNLGFRVVLYVK